MAQSRNLLLLFVLVFAPAIAQNPQAKLIGSPSASAEQTSQIAAIQSQLVELRKVYKESYPDIRKLEIQLQALQNSQNTSNPKTPAIASSIASSDRAGQTAAIQSQLVELRKIYKESYPDIRRLEIQLQALQTPEKAPSK